MNKDFHALIQQQLSSLEDRRKTLKSSAGRVAQSELSHLTDKQKNNRLKLSSVSDYA